MTPECHIVRDIQPLYQEGLVSDGTAAFVRNPPRRRMRCWRSKKSSGAGRR